MVEKGRELVAGRAEQLKVLEEKVVGVQAEVDRLYGMFLFPQTY